MNSLWNLKNLSQNVEPVHRIARLKAVLHSVAWPGDSMATGSTGGRAWKAVGVLGWKLVRDKWGALRPGWCYASDS